MDRKNVLYMLCHNCSCPFCPAVLGNLATSLETDYTSLAAALDLLIAQITKLKTEVCRVLLWGAAVVHAVAVNI